MNKWNFSQADVYAMLPGDAKWSCSFGYPGQGGFTEFWVSGGRRWIIQNGPWCSGYEWSIYAEI